jgi:predicted GIY-YIG superfamily endonuclease
MKGLMIYPSLYVLKLEDDCWYVGITMDLNKRLAQHWSGEGAKWTKLHKPISVDRVIFPADQDTIENDITKEYMELYGKEKVRGGSWCKVDG